MTQYSIVTDLDRCVGCLACSVACKVVNGVPTGSFWNKTLRIGPNPKEGGSGQWPDVELYFLNVQCQHCENPECVKVCPTGASHKTEDGTVQIDKSKCIGCEQKIAQGELPQCVSQCCGMARWFGDLDQGIEGFVGPRGELLGEYLTPFSDDQVHSLPDVGNRPSLRYILRDMKWQGGGE